MVAVRYQTQPDNSCYTIGMSIDDFIHRILPLSTDSFVLTEQNFQGHVKKHFTESLHSRVLYVALPWWGFRRVESLSAKIVKRGYSFLGYEFPVGILSADYQATRRYFEMIRDMVVEDIRRLQAIHRFSEVNILGMSLGCVHAAMVSEVFPFDAVTLVVPGHCLAESMWVGIRTQHLKKLFEKQGVTLERLKKEWSALAPEHNIHNLSQASVTVYLSRSDKVIPYCFGKKLVEVMRDQGLYPGVRENKYWGHYGTVKRFMRRPVKKVTLQQGVSDFA